MILNILCSQIVVDALMLSGTNPSLMIVREWILQGKIAGEQAVQAISALVPTVETPTKELLASLMVRTNDELRLKNSERFGHNAFFNGIIAGILEIRSRPRTSPA